MNSWRPTLNKVSFVLFTNKQYTYNSCYDEHTTNGTIYKQSIKPIVQSSLDGINGTVFMYGQTGSGKTYTMLGDYSKEIREGNIMGKRSGSIKRMRSGSRNHTIQSSNSLKRNQSFGALPNRMGFNSSAKFNTIGIQKLNSAGGTNHGLPPKSAGQPHAQSDDQNNPSNTMSFASSIHNCKQYNVTPKKGITPLTRNKSEGKLQTISTLGNDDSYNKGVLIYSLNELFNGIDNYVHRSPDKSFEESKEQGDNMKTNTFIVRCSYFEIYNDTVYDLLADINDFDKPLLVCEDPKKKDFYVRGLKKIVVDTLDECLDILKMGEYNRHYAATSMNHQSSRSHTIFRLSIQNIEHLYKDSYSFDGNYSVLKESILNFIDLAGSEKVSNHHNSKVGSKGMMSDVMISSSIQDRVNEGKHINKSLFFLTQVISMKAKGKSEHIPFRNSPLTKILRSSLGGNSRTSIICCATPTVSQYEQSLSTLRFGTSAKKIENKITANITKDHDEEGLKAIISDYETKLKTFENDRDKIDELKREKQELENDQLTLKQRLMKVNENMIMTSQPSTTSPNESNTDNAIIHWDGIGIIHTCTKVKNFIDNTKIHQGWKVAAVEIKRDKRFVRSLENSLNSQLKKAALETKKYAEQVKKENSTLTSKLEKATKKIKNIELAKGFDKCSDELLNKWEKIFTN